MIRTTDTKAPGSFRYKHFCDKHYSCLATSDPDPLCLSCKREAEADRTARATEALVAENERLRAENARLKALARDYLAQCECPVIHDDPWQQALTDAVKE